MRISPLPKLLSNSSLAALSVAAFIAGAAPVSAQTAPASPPTTAEADNSQSEVVITGTLFRNPNATANAPITSLSANDLAQRGITSVADAVRSVAADGAGTLPTSFSANGAFAQGAASASLRGLTTNSTLVLFDGIRGAYYPFADDGTRSFVDLNTIPEAVIERVEVLKDGASSTYGADAIAGVVNIITKKQIKGLSLVAEGGISDHGDAGEQRLTATYGFGDLATQGFNFYVSGEYQHDSQVFNRDRGFPYNTTDLTNRPGVDGVTPGPNNNQNGQGVAPNQATTTAIVRPATLTDPNNILTGVAIAGGATQILSASGCGQGTAFVNGGAGGNYCQQDIVNQYGVIQPDQTRLGVTARLTAQVGSNATAYAMATFYQNRVSYLGTPEGTQARQPTTIRGIVLPALLSNGQVNPQNPFANIIDPTTGQRQSALLQYRFGDIPNSTTVTSRSYRAAAGINGSFGEGWTYNADATYMRVNLDNKNRGLLNYNGLINAINNGTYNFMNPAANTADVRASISPDVDTKAHSDLWQVQAVITKDLFDLPGGKLQAAVGGQVRHENIYDPVQDPLATDQTYSIYSTANVNTFSAIGKRYVEAAFFEVNAPILDQVELNASGRYDHYSTGFSHFSPKIGAKIKPISQITLRSTFSKGFRAPSIPESNGNVIGYTTATPPPEVVAQHCTQVGSTCVPNGYVKSYGLGQFSSGNPNLKPETSQNFTAGAVVQPTRWLNLSVDYFRIKKKNLIIGGSEFGDAIAAYYASGGTNLEPIAGYTILQNPADPEHPNAIRTVQVVSALYENAQKLVVDGLDFAAQVNLRLGSNVRLTSQVDATRNLTYNIYTPSGVQKFVGTLGPYNYTSGAGTPKWRANWQNTLEVGRYGLSATAYYTGGYIDAADDATGAGSAHDAPCAPGGAASQLSAASDGNTAEACHIRRFIQVDLTGSIKVNDRFSIYANVLNVFNAHAPFDPAQYSANNYNPAYGQQGVIGRFMRIGARVNF
jgi:iron complex outermembrane receptor protein